MLSFSTTLSHTHTTPTQHPHNTHTFTYCVVLLHNVDVSTQRGPFLDMLSFLHCHVISTHVVLPTSHCPFYMTLFFCTKLSFLQYVVLLRYVVLLHFVDLRHYGAEVPFNLQTSAFKGEVARHQLVTKRRKCVICRLRVIVLSIARLVSFPS